MKLGKFPKELLIGAGVLFGSQSLDAHQPKIPAQSSEIRKETAEQTDLKLKLGDHYYGLLLPESSEATVGEGLADEFNPDIENLDSLITSDGISLKAGGLLDLLKTLPAHESITKITSRVPSDKPGSELVPDGHRILQVKLNPDRDTASLRGAELNINPAEVRLRTLSQLAYEHLPHELAHPAFRRALEKLPLDKKINLISSVIARLHADDAFVGDGYVAGIRAEDKKKELFLKINEYAAEILGHYFSGGKLSYSDAKICLEVIKALGLDDEAVNASLQKRAGYVRQMVSAAKGSLADLFKNLESKKFNTDKNP